MESIPAKKRYKHQDIGLAVDGCPALASRVINIAS
jgi:hypothetical protein